MTLAEANATVAQLGGFGARRCDGPPGVESLTIGLRRLHDMTFGWRAHLAHLHPTCV
jgi:hypothetical protein